MEEIITFLQSELEKEKKLSSICEKFRISEFEILGYVYKLKENGVNIDCYSKDGEYYLIRNEHPDLSQVNTYNFRSDVNETKKIAVISEIRAGSKCEQFRVLNDMFLKFNREGIKDVFILGNLLEGQYVNKFLFTLFFQFLVVFSIGFLYYIVLYIVYSIIISLL